MRTILPIVSLLFLSLIVNATDHSDPLPVLNKIKMIQMQHTATKVLNDLKMAKGILASEPPFLQVKKFSGSLKLAVFYHDKNEIHLDSLSYVIMRGMGKDSLNALAFLLGHELGHYINRHKKINHAIEDATPDLIQNARVRDLSTTINEQNPNLEFDKKLESAIDDYSDTHNEAEADFEGGFLGYLAGYQPLQAGKEFLRRAYNHPFMNMSRRSPGYPTFDERLEIINKTSSELQELIPVFEMANYLVALEQYQDAIPYFEKIIRKFQSRELYNNIGVSMMLEILRLFEEPLTEYKFPLTLDASFRVPHPDLNPVSSVADLSFTPGWLVHTKCHLNSIQNQIEVAEEYFEKALDLDKKYEAAHLNLSIAYSIKSLLFQFNTINGTVDCSEREYEELQKAFASAISAKQLTEATLAGYLVNSFSKEDNIPAFIEALEAPDGTIVKQAYKIQSFNAEIMVREGSDPHVTADSTSWFKRNESTHMFGPSVMPEKAQLLSNIYAQEDLVHILMGKLKQNKITKKNPFGFGQVEVVPFNRALDINPKNELAKHNKRTALNLAVPSNPESSTVQQCGSIKEHFENKPVAEISAAQSSWVYDEQIEVSKLNFDNFEEFGFFGNSLHQLQFAQTEKFNLYRNTTREDLDNRVESCQVLEIKPNSLESTSCEIRVGDSLEKLIEQYGDPTRSLNLSSGSYLTIILSTSGILKGKEEKNSVLVDFEIPSGAELPIKAAEVNFVEDIEHGIIFKLNNDNKVIQWALYDKKVQTSDGSMN